MTKIRYAVLVLTIACAAALSARTLSVKYGEDKGRLADLRCPDTPGFATVVWFHGGGLVEGSRKQCPAFTNAVATLSVDYRLLPSAKWSDPIDDAAHAVAWALEHIAEYGGDPKKVFVAGHSAGGYLTGMVGLDPEWLKKYGHQPSELAGLIPVSGQMTEHSAVRKANGDKGHRFLQRVNARAPLHWVSAKAPPIFAVTGASRLDMPTRKEQNELLIAALRAVGHADARFVEIPDADHGSVVDKCVPLVDAFVLEISSRD